MNSGEEKAPRPHIANKEQCQAFWVSVIRNKELPMRDRRKALELLARSEGGPMVSSPLLTCPLPKGVKVAM